MADSPQDGEQGPSIPRLYDRRDRRLVPPSVPVCKPLLDEPHLSQVEEHITSAPHEDGGGGDNWFKAKYHSLMRKKHPAPTTRQDEDHGTNAPHQDDGTATGGGRGGDNWFKRLYHSVVRKKHPRHTTLPVKPLLEKDEEHDTSAPHRDDGAAGGGSGDKHPKPTTFNRPEDEDETYGELICEPTPLTSSEPEDEDETYGEETCEPTPFTSSEDEEHDASDPHQDDGAAADDDADDDAHETWVYTSDILTGSDARLQQLIADLFTSPNPRPEQQPSCGFQSPSSSKGSRTSSSSCESTNSSGDSQVPEFDDRAGVLRKLYTYRRRPSCGFQSPSSCKGRRTSSSSSESTNSSGDSQVPEFDDRASVLTKSYAYRTDAANEDGTDFEIKICALVFLRAVQSYSSFTMTSNDPRAGGFDDIVVSYGSPGNEQSILVQLKTSNKPINFIPPRSKSLKDYFQSVKISNTSKYFMNCTYVIFTNANVDLNPSVANVGPPTKNLLCTSWKHDDVFQVGLNDDICDEFRDDTGAEDFVNRLLIFRNQSGLEYLDELIKQELFKICNGFVPEYLTIQQTFVEKIKDWFDGKAKTALDENWEEWTELKAQLLGQNILLKEIKFSEDTLSDLERRVLDSESEIIIFKSESTEAQIACFKLYQTFMRKQCLRVLFTDISQPHQIPDMLFSLWSTDEWDVLVITDVTNCCQKLRDNIANYKGNPEKQNKKKIVIVSSSDASILGLSQDAVDVSGTEIIKSTFSQLDINSQHRLQNLPVNFQGKEILLGEIMDDKILEGGLLQYVLTSPTIQIGEALPKCNGIYIPRTLSTRIVVDGRILNSNDKLFFCGIKENDLKILIAKARGQGDLDEQWYSEQKHRFNIKSPEELEETIRGFKCCTEELSEGPVHFLKVIDGTLYWMYSHGNTNNLYECIEGWPLIDNDCDRLIKTVRCWRAKEEDLVRKEFRKVIVAGEPGSGKTALLREAARTMKELFPHRWVINIDLNQHSKIFDQIRSGNVTHERVLHLLSKAANLDNSEVGRQLLKYHVLDTRGNICVLFDAFDEIAPSYIDTVLDILKFIWSDFRPSTLWVASRCNMKDKLEDKLGRKAFNIEPLSDQEQLCFLSELWDEAKAKKFQRTVLDKIPCRDGVRLSSFPLHLKIICEVCHDLDLSDISMLFNITNLYEQFIEMKLDIYFEKELGLNGPSAQIDIIKDELCKRFMKRHMICSVVVLNILNELDKSKQSSIMKKIQNICQDIEKGGECLEIIDGIVDGKPHFLHRTFAEHFAGKWLAKHWKENKALIRLSVSAFWLEIVYESFCQELARELPAHLAVLNGDINALEGLKEEDLNKTDVLGRTPLHLAAQRRDKGARQVVLKLLEYDSRLEIADDLFHFTPLYYAAEVESWDVVRILLERGARVIGKEIEQRKEFVEAMEGAGRLRVLKPAGNYKEMGEFRDDTSVPFLFLRW